MTRFRTKVLAAGKTAAGVEVPEKVVLGLGSTKRPMVKATIKGYTYRSSIARMGGRYMLSVSNDVRAHTGVVPGETIDIDVELDTDKRDVEVPPELAKALAKDVQAKKYFESLSYSRKYALAAPISNGKSPETRERNLAKALANLKAES
jgi:hypothetical protein